MKGRSLYELHITMLSIHHFSYYNSIVKLILYCLLLQYTVRIKLQANELYRIGRQRKRSSAAAPKTRLQAVVAFVTKVWRILRNLKMSLVKIKNPCKIMSKAVQCVCKHII